MTLENLGVLQRSNEIKQQQMKALNGNIEKQEINKDEINLHKPKAWRKEQEKSKDTKLQCKWKQ